VPPSGFSHILIAEEWETHSRYNDGAKTPEDLVLS